MSISQASLHPIVLRQVPFPELLDQILKKYPTPALVIICSDRQSWIQNLNEHLRKAAHQPEDSETSKSTDVEENLANASAHDLSERLLRRSLNLLTTSRAVKLAFCNSVAVLHAYLTSLPFRDDQDPIRRETKHGAPGMYLLNPLTLHKACHNFSAQSLGKTFAMAVEAAWRGGQKLCILESPLAAQHDNAGNEETTGNGDEDDGTSSADSPMDYSLDPWSEEVPVLNANTRTFGTADGKDFLERAVRISDVVGRWCIFEEPTVL